MPQYYTPFLTQAGTTIGKALESRGLRQQKEAQNRLAGSAYMGDPGAMEELMQVNPQLGVQIQERAQKRKESTQQQQLQKRGQFKKEYDSLMVDIAKFDSFEDAKEFADARIADIGQRFPEIMGKIGADAVFDEKDFQLAKQLAGEEDDVGKAFAKINPLDYTTDSLRNFQESGDFADLAPRVVKSEEEIAKELAVNFKNAKALRGEFTKATKNFADINDAFGRIKVSSKNPSPAGDLSLIFNYMKMLDPESVVRESEFATAAATGSYGDRTKAMVNKIINGEKLSAAQRADFAGRASKLFDESARIHEGRVQEFTTKAEQFDIDPSQVIFQRQFHETIGEEPPVIETPAMSDEEYEAKKRALGL